MKFTFSLIIILMTVTVCAYGGYLFLQSQQLKNRSEAVDGCLHASLYRTSFNTPAGGTITTETAIESDVQKCLELKGVN